MDHFILLGDMGSGNNDQLIVSNAIHKKINEINKKDIFVCGLGDNIYEDGCHSVNDKQFITKFENPYENISNDIKFYMCLGNHDYGFNVGLENNSQYQVDYGILSQQNNKIWVMPSKYYTFKKKNIQFFVMDTNFEFMNKQELKMQLDYLVKEINKSIKPWKILIGHHTLRSVGGHGNATPNGVMENFFEELFKKCKIHLYICGHDHNKQVIETTIGDKNTSLIVCGTCGKKYHDYINLKNVEEGELQFASSNIGYGLCQCSKKTLPVTFYDGENTQEYVYKLNNHS